MPNTFLERLNSGTVMVSDGATGTNYQKMGLGLGVPPEEWVIDEPHNVLALHSAFVEAGSDIILTCSFGGTRIRMRDSKYAERAPEINFRAAQLARQAASQRDGVLVGGSLGPTGQLCEPYGELTHDAAVSAYAEQAAALTDGGVDFLILETFFALEEAVAAIEGVKRASALPLVVSFSYDQGTRTMMGLRPSQVVAAIAPLGVAAIGANCGKSLDTMEQIVAELSAQRAGIPLWIKPNAGLPRMVGDVAEYDISPEMMAAYATRFVRAGASVVGGCCGSTPAHVAAIAQAVKAVAREDALPTLSLSETSHDLRG
ncbi:MAG: homocysteine S-methyltransferase family protein [Chloroflexi bacterium]|nr:homocysteine S-methyltransferase family protein [Chloroflexota bacterium]